VKQLQPKNGKLHLSQPTPPAFHLSISICVGNQLLLRPTFLLKKLPQGRWTNSSWINKGLESLKKLIRLLLVTPHPSTSDPCTPLPHLPVRLIIILQSRPHWNQCSAITLGPKPQIHPIYPLPSWGIQVSDQRPSQTSYGPLIIPLSVKENKIQVRVKVKIPRPQFSQGQKGKPF
jgi:hypothetical protein